MNNGNSIEFMNVIDELVPLTEKDIELLKSQQFTSTWGCSIVCFILGVVLCLITYQFFWKSYLIVVLLGIICLLLLLTGIGFLKQKKMENAKVTLDLNEGNKRRIIAPIEEKEIIDVTRRPHPLNIKKQIIKSNQETKLKYYMTVKEFRFPLTEDQYIAGARKGDIVEFFVAPHSKIVLSQPVEIKK